MPPPWPERHPGRGGLAVHGNAEEPAAYHSHAKEVRISLAPLIARYGVLAIFVGAGVEGEAVVVSGGVLAHKGLLPFWQVAVAAAAGSFLADQIWFFAGRFSRDRPWVRRLTARPAFSRALELLERHSIGFILAFRFIYGMRTVSPIAIGTSKVPIRRFLLFNAIAAALWGPAIAGIGLGLGQAIEPLLHRLRSPWVIGAAALLVIGAAAIAWWVARRRTVQR